MSTRRYAGYFHLLIFLMSLSHADEHEDALPLWEAGIAAGALTVPQYIGSDERYTLPLAFPYVIYRGKIFSADEDGLRGLFFDSDNISYDLGFSFGLPVGNDVDARQGMPDLYLVGQVGPRLNWQLYDSPNGATITFRLPVRFAMDIRGTSVGWVTEPSLKIEKNRLGKNEKFSARIDLGLLYAQDRYNEYYYGVPAQFATSTRPEYEASSGLHSYMINLSTSFQKSEHLSIGIFVRLRTLRPGVVDDSPLVVEPFSWSAGVGFAWSFFQSERMANRRR